jgi:hypothetical protein
LVSRLLKVLAIGCSVITASSFTFFAVDRFRAPTLGPQRTPAAHHVGEPRRTIDALSARLTEPFRTLIHSNSQWVGRAVSTLLALLVYGLGLGYLARYARAGRARAPARQ